MLFESFEPHIAWIFPSKPPWDFLQFLGRHPAPPNAATGIPDVGILILQFPTTSKPGLCHKIHPVWPCIQNRSDSELTETFAGILCAGKWLHDSGEAFCEQKERGLVLWVFGCCSL